MVEIVRLKSGEPSEWPLEELKAAKIYHSDPLDASFGWLQANGYSPAPLPEAGIREGLIVVPSTRRSDGSSIEELVSVVDRLLGPGGCPWDQAQTHETLKRHLLEEAH